VTNDTASTRLRDRFCRSINRSSPLLWSASSTHAISIRGAKSARNPSIASRPKRRPMSAQVFTRTNDVVTRRVGQLADSQPPDLDTVTQAPGLLDARDDEDGRDCRTEQEVIVLRQEEDLLVLEAFASPRIRSAPPIERDDVVSAESLGAPAPEQREREVLVE
jgi:hypothetical protein